ncbi:MAG TPA: hypothetical protein VM934_03670 [Pyrinomonadaceae bacterium]|jgi:hypothetical protein|nr:hypothetical protein [Pyrinomonadaceae bacterium]
MKRHLSKLTLALTLGAVGLAASTISLTTVRASDQVVYNCSTDGFKCTSQGTCTGHTYTRSGCSIQCYKNIENQDQPGQIEATSSATCGSPVPPPPPPGGGGGGTGPIGGGGGGWDGGGGLWDRCDPFWYADYDAYACDSWGMY